MIELVSANFSSIYLFTQFPAESIHTGMLHLHPSFQIVGNVSINNNVTYFMTTKGFSPSYRIISTRHSSHLIER